MGRRWVHRSALLGAALLPALLACTPLPLDVGLGTTPGNGPRIVGVARGGVLAQAAVLEPPAVPAEHLPTLVAVAPDERVEVVVMTMGSPLAVLGLTPGLRSADQPGRPEDPTIATYFPSAVTVEVATVEDDAVSAFQPLAALPPWLASFRLPATSPCLDLRPRPILDLPVGAAFVVALGDGRALAGTRGQATRDALFVVDQSGQARSLTLARPADVADPTRFAAMGALPITGTTDEVWLSLRLGELWRVRIPGPGDDAITLLDRVDYGGTDGLAYLQGTATRGAVEIYGLRFADNTLVRFDGTSTARELHTCGQGAYFAGGVAVDADGAVVAGCTAQNAVVIGRGDAVTVVELEGSREGVTSAGFVPGVGVLVSDGKGRIYRREGVELVPVVDLDLGTGAHAIVPRESGFIAAGGAGAIREWRSAGSTCPVFPPGVSQTLRYWAPLGAGYLVSGPPRDGAQGGATPTPLTWFLPE